MSDLLPVQKDVPLPTRQPRQPRRKYPFETMNVGDMFFVPERTVKSMSAYVSRTTKDLAATFNVRKTWMYRDSDDEWVLCSEDHPRAVLGAGVWRAS